MDRQMLVALTRLHILQNYSGTITTDKETFEFFKKSHKNPPKREPPVYQKPVQIQEQPVKKPAAVPIAPKQVAQAPIAEVPYDPASSLLFALCRSRQKTEPLQLTDIGKNSEAIPKDSSKVDWNYPNCVIIAFSQTSFLEKIALAIQERLKKRCVLLSPNIESAADLIAYCACGAIQCAIIAYDQSSMAKAKSWIASLPDLEDVQNQVFPITCTNTLYGICLNELQLQENPTTEEKSTLWKALQQLLR